MMYDIISYNSFSASDENEKKNKLVLFKIDKNKHEPILCLNIEEALQKEDAQIETITEVYDDVKINKLAHQVYITVSDPKTNQDIVYIFDLIKHQFMDMSIKHTKFNNYNYIDQTLFEEVEEHKFSIKQLYQQVKKITDHLSE